MADPKPKTCRPLLDSTSQLVFLTLEITGDEASRLPGRILEALQSKEVQKAIETALLKEAKQLLTNQATGKAVESNSGAGFAQQVGKPSFNALSSDVRKQIENSPELLRLKKEAHDVLKDFQCTPVGTWVNENRTVAVIAGIALALAGGVAMYFTKRGDPLAKLVEGKGKKVKLGKVELKGTFTKFEPSSQTVGASLSLTGKWDALKTDLTIAGTAVGSGGSASADGSIQVPLTGSLSAVASGKFDLGAAKNGNEPRLRLRPSRPASGWNQFDYRLAAGLKYAGEGKDKGLSLEILAIVNNNQFGGRLTGKYQHSWTDWRLKAELSGEVGPAQQAVRGTLGLERMGAIPVELNAQGKFDSQGVYQLQTNLVFRLP